MTDHVTLRDLTGMPTEPAPLSESVLVMVDLQNTYTTGVMALDGVDDALAEAERLLARARDAGAAIVHIRHDAGVDTPYDVTADIGQIVDRVAPREGEPVVTKNLPDSFVGTALGSLIDTTGRTDLVIAGFMTHMCVASTTRGAFSRGYTPSVVAGATATRSLPFDGATVAASDLQRSSLAALGDMFALVVPDSAALR